MEHIIGRAKFPAKCVKNEIHNILTTLRLTRATLGAGGSQATFHMESLRSFQRLFEELTYIHELHEFDTVAYLGPFLEVIQSDATSGELTAVALEAVDKFVSFGLIHPDSPRCMEAVNTLAWGVINCRFLSDGSAKDEVVLLKMVGLLIDCLRCQAGEYLSDPCVWHMVRKCFQISRQPRATHLLRSSTEGMLQQMVLTIFGTHKERSQRVRIKNPPTQASPGSESGAAPAPGGTLQVYKPYGFKAMHFVLRFLAFLLAYGRTTPKAGEKDKPHKSRVRRTNRSRSPSAERSPGGRSRSQSGEENEDALPLGLQDAPAAAQEDLLVDTHCLGLSLLNVALESGGDEIARSDELISVIQDDICKSLLHNSRTASLSVLSLTLRAIFNLFLHFKLHLKVQLEIFFTSVHLKIAGDNTASYEQRELALESLLEFCREPGLMLELYENYDCDVRCTNLFETLVKFLITHAYPAGDTQEAAAGAPRASFNSLHKLALSGLLSILHSISLRCESHKHFRGDSKPKALASEEPGSPTVAETELQRKKDQKRRMTIAARTFNSEPSKSTAALQSLGLLSSPLTAESMAEFLRHTPALDLRVVGEYLSKRHEFNGQVRKVFMGMFPFPGLGLVEALRTLLASFRLPGEAQCIERLMESFAEAYFRAQPLASEGASVEDPLKVVRWIPRERPLSSEEARSMGGGPEDGAGEQPARVQMSNSDTIFVLSFSIIMLNTDLHNPGVKKKMSLEEFLRNNRGIDGGKSMPEYFLRDIYEAIRDDEIRLHGDAPIDGPADQVIDDFFWEGILLRSESMDAFSATERLLSESPPGTTERDMLQVIMDCQPMPALTQCYELVPDAAVAQQAMTGFQDLARISAYFDQFDSVSILVKATFQYCARAAAGGFVSVRCQIALGAAEHCVGSFSPLFREAEWRAMLEAMLQLWALDLLPQHLAEFDDFFGTDGKPLESLCNIRPLFPAPACQTDDAQVKSAGTGKQAWADPSLSHDSGDGFLESLARWFEDEIGDTDDEAQGNGGNRDDLVLVGARSSEGSAESKQADAETLPVKSSDPGTIHQKVKQWFARSGFVDILASQGIAKISAESLLGLAKALVQLSRPANWQVQGQSSPTSAGTPAAEGASSKGEAPAAAAVQAWHEVADPVFCLEVLTDLTCLPLSASQCVSQIWPLVSTHFEKLLQYVIAGNGGAERQFIERLIVNTLRLCIRLIGNSELVPTLLTLSQHLARLPAGLFSTYSERIACGLFVLVREADLPHSGLVVIFALLKRISEFPSSVGACSAGIECLNHWLSDDQELSRLLSLQQFPELLNTLKAFAQQNSTQASATALGHLSSLVPQLARGARCLPPEAQSQWRSLWVPTLHALADIARCGSQRCSAQAFVYLQRLLLECGTDLALPWEQLEFSAWKECLEQVLLPLLQSPAVTGENAQRQSEDLAGLRQANAAQLVCRVLLTHMSEWLRSSPDGFPVLFLRLLHVLVSEATGTGPSKEPLIESLKNLLLVISVDPVFAELKAPSQGETLIEAAWGVVSPTLPGLRDEVALILDPMAASSAAAETPSEA
eukprot:TRINITY_DN7643_c0_g3_i1.p1 TRINITY_DN7643_c0_g3~~TRINITY_DN7643_c0_g3_i1.p1  ORF type:complete len:1562 (-),score=332.89 TRINITY_DN7643_c0_g3_i1:103-4788(-)